MPHLQSWHWTEAGRSLSKVSLVYRARTWTARPTQRMKKKGKVPKQSLILECILSTAAFMQTEIHRKSISLAQSFSFKRGLDVFTQKLTYPN